MAEITLTAIPMMKIKKANQASGPVTNSYMTTSRVLGLLTFTCDDTFDYYIVI
jgi:hypothetical protein